MMFEREKLLNQMRAIDWLDVQTESLTVSTLVYTEGIEMLTPSLNQVVRGWVGAWVGGWVGGGHTNIERKFKSAISGI